LHENLSINGKLLDPATVIKSGVIEAIMQNIEAVDIAMQEKYGELLSLLLWVFVLCFAITLTSNCYKMGRADPKASGYLHYLQALFNHQDPNIIGVTLQVLCNIGAKCKYP
jgi:hypothetical protein